MNLRKWSQIAGCALGLSLPALSAFAQEDPLTQILELGRGHTDATMASAISLADLPETDSARQDVFAALLRANPVTTFVTSPEAEDRSFDQFFLVADLGLDSTGETYGLTLGETRLGLDEFADRAGAVIGAFNPDRRSIGFLRLADPNGDFPMAMADLRGALDQLGFEMLVLMIGADATAGACDIAPEDELHVAIVAGLADRAPFGNGDGASSGAEVEAFLGDALSRMVARQATCAPKYSLILKAADAPDQAMVTHATKSGLPDLETRLYHEIFEARFLMQSDDRAAVEGFLASCRYCPNEAELATRLDEMRETAMAAQLEAEIWDRIKQDDTPVRLAIYLESCTLCAHRHAAEQRIQALDQSEAVRDTETRAFQAALTARDMAGLQAYADGCLACEHGDAAAAAIAEIESELDASGERAALAMALDSGDPVKMQDYLDNCRICQGTDEITEALVQAHRKVAIMQPCLLHAGLPQLGGPRKLDEIDVEAATTACGEVAKTFPDDGLVQTLLGRIAQAAGDEAAATAAYQTGMVNSVPAAFGLAAYTLYAPENGAVSDLQGAEDLALQGAELGDWLSQEILTVLYSKDLIPGKSAEDAFRVAMEIAEDGDPLAQYFVGYYYLTGTGVEASEADAATWLERAVAHGYTSAMPYLADLLEQGRGVTPSPDRAAELYWQALQDGDVTAINRLTSQLRSRDRDVIRFVQGKLREAQVYFGSIDGIAGKGTVSAIERYAQTLESSG